MGKGQCQKLKNILANPFKLECPPSLGENEMESLKNILLKYASCKSPDMKDRPSDQKIQIGLESSLRCINKRQASCVFLSLNIKPAYIIHLIACNANAKDKTTLVFAQSNLEEFTQSIYGIKATAMVFPKNIETISEELFYWHKGISKSKINNKITSLEQHDHKNNTILDDPQGNTRLQLSTGNKQEHRKRKSDLLKTTSYDINALNKSDNELCDTKQCKEILIENDNKAPDFIPLNLTSQTKNEATELMHLSESQKNGNKQKTKSKNSFPKYQNLVVKKIKPNPKRLKKNKVENKTNRKSRNSN